MMKKVFILLIVIFAVVVFTTVAIFIAPYMITSIGQALYDKWHTIPYDSEVIVVYNWLLGFIAFALSAITFVLYRRNRLRIYTLLFIPHIVALVIAMFYIGIKIRYIGDGYIVIKSPISGYYDYRNPKGKMIIHSSKRLYKTEHNGTIIFSDRLVKFTWTRLNVLYDKDGVCFLRKPLDDEFLYSYSDLYYSEKSYYKDDYFDHCRVRFYDEYGNYMITRIYGVGGYFPEEESGELLSEYMEEVDELPDGIKIFKNK